jgi:uncharacterized membrane protein
MTDHIAAALGAGVQVAVIAALIAGLIVIQIWFGPLWALGVAVVCVLATSYFAALQTIRDAHPPEDTP